MKTDSDPMARHEDGVDHGLSTGLAWFSVALGTVELLAPRFLSRAIGIRMNPRVMRAFGLREIASGVGMLLRPGSVVGPRARVAGDVMDLVALGASPSRRRAAGWGRAAALLAVAGVAALDLYASRSRYSS